MATTQNRTFFGGSTAPGSGVYPEDVKVLKVFKNYAETDYNPLASSDTSIYIPTVEQVDSSGTSINVTIQKILASGGYPVLVYNNEEYQYTKTDGTPSKYVFMCLSDLSTLKRVEVDVSTGVISASSAATGGGAIYPSLQSAIADASNLVAGDIFETNGFHTSGDGGAARYLVSSTGTANGMDIVQLATGKLAILQVGDWIIPEQLGYEQSYSRNDVVPYIQRAITIGCQHIHMRSSGSGAGYTWKSKLTVTSRGFKLTGEGDWGYPNKFTYIVFRPTDASVDAMIDMKARDVVLKDLDIEVTGDYVKSVDGITNTGYDSDENRFWEIDNVRFNSFDNCIKFAGGIKWQNSIKNCLFNSCKIGLQIYESSTFELIVENCLFINCEQYDVLVNGNLFAALFNSCGFGSQGTAIGLTTNSDTYMYQNVKFEGCNFELDNLAVQNAPALFIDCFPNPSHPYLRQNVTLSNCHLTICKISYPVQDTTNRFFRLAPKTNLLLIANQILGKDEDEHPDWVVYPKLLWNENYLPTLGFGGIIECGDNLCGNGNFEYPDQLLPFVTRSTQARSVLAIGAQSGTESAVADCNAFIPAHCGEFVIGRVSTFENTANMPTTFIFGFLYSVGVTEGPNKRVIQMMIASNSNIYTRIGRDVGGGWTWDAWKVISDLPNGLLAFDSVADTNSSAIQVWGGNTTSGLGTYKSIGNISVPAGHIADITIAGSLQHNLQNNATNTIVFQLSEQDSLDNDAVAQPVYIRSNGVLAEISLSLRFVVRNTSSSTKTYYFGAYNLSSVPTGDIIELANKLNGPQGLRITLISYGVNSNV